MSREVWIVVGYDLRPVCSDVHDCAFSTARAAHAAAHAMMREDGTMALVVRASDARLTPSEALALGL